jgi:hypothetical protein
MTPITNKPQMYAMLAGGRLGNTIPQYFTVHDWVKSGDADRYGWWGVRTLKPGGPCRLNCPRAEVMSTAYEFAQPVNISMMIDKCCTVTAWLELWDSPAGLVVEGVEYPDTAGGWTWRNSMPDPQRRKRWEGVAARVILRRHLNANSLDDVTELLGRHPDHVFELSATDRCFGTVPHRNHITWELRLY